MSTVWQKYLASWTSFLSAENLHQSWDDFLLVCVFPVVKAAQGSEQSELPVQFTAWPHKELRCDGWWRQWGRGTRKEPDILESVLLPSKRNIESYCEILEILAFGCWKTDGGLKQSWAYFLLPHPFILNKIGEFFSCLQRQGVIVLVSSTTRKQLLQPNAPWVGPW